MKKRPIVFRNRSPKNEKIKSVDNSYPHTTSVFHSLSYYMEGGIDPDRIMETQAQAEFDSVDDLGSASANAWCNPRVDDFDIHESLQDDNKSVDAATVTPQPNVTETE